MLDQIIVIDLVEDGSDDLVEDGSDYEETESYQDNVAKLETKCNKWNKRLTA